MNTPNPRVAKLADQIRVVVAETLERRVKDPRLGFVTITDVRLTGDSRDATRRSPARLPLSSRPRACCAPPSARGSSCATPRP